MSEHEIEKLWQPNAKAVEKLYPVTPIQIQALAYSTTISITSTTCRLPLPGNGSPHPIIHLLTKGPKGSEPFLIKTNSYR